MLHGHAHPAIGRAKLEGVRLREIGNPRWRVLAGQHHADATRKIDCCFCLSIKRPTDLANIPRRIVLCFISGGW